VCLHGDRVRRRRRERDERRRHGVRHAVRTVPHGYMPRRAAVPYVSRAGGAAVPYVGRAGRRAVVRRVHAASSVRQRHGRLQARRRHVRWVGTWCRANTCRRAAATVLHVRRRGRLVHSDDVPRTGASASPRHAGRFLRFAPVLSSSWCSAVVTGCAIRTKGSRRGGRCVAALWLWRSLHRSLSPHTTRQHRHSEKYEKASQSHHARTTNRGVGASELAPPRDITMKRVLCQPEVVLVELRGSRWHSRRPGSTDTVLHNSTRLVGGGNARQRCLAGRQTM
jgi:hypothetical protein